MFIFLLLLNLFIAFTPKSPHIPPSFHFPHPQIIKKPATATQGNYTRSNVQSTLNIYNFTQNANYEPNASSPTYLRPKSDPRSSLYPPLGDSNLEQWSRLLTEIETKPEWHSPTENVMEDATLVDSDIDLDMEIDYMYGALLEEESHLESEEEMLIESTTKAQYIIINHRQETGYNGTGNDSAGNITVLTVVKMSKDEMEDQEEWDITSGETNITEISSQTQSGDPPVDNNREKCGEDTAKRLLDILKATADRRNKKRAGRNDIEPKGRKLWLMERRENCDTIVTCSWVRLPPVGKVCTCEREFTCARQKKT